MLKILQVILLFKLLCFAKLVLVGIDSF